MNINSYPIEAAKGKMMTDFDGLPARMRPHSAASPIDRVP